MSWITVEAGGRTEFRPGEAFTWAVESVDDPVAVWGYTLEPRGDGVLLGMHATMGHASSPPRDAAAADRANAPAGTTSPLD